MEVVALEMKVLRRSLLAVAALLVATSNATPIDTVVLVVADDLGSSDLGFTGFHGFDHTH